MVCRCWDALLAHGLARPPSPELCQLARQATEAQTRTGLPFGFVWQGARYEGLVTVFLEHLGGFGGRIFDDAGRVVVDATPAVHALTYMRDSIYQSGVVPQATLTWQEEQTRFAFQNGQAVFMRNWPYAAVLLQDRAESQVAGRFAVAPMPASPGGSPTAVLGGSQLAINANSNHPHAAYAVIAYLLQPEQMRVRRVIERAVPRPITPVYAELSEILQIRLHRALTRQQEPADALADAARAMRELLEKVGLASGTDDKQR